jgi:nucleoside-triphosphatase THEP1
MKNLKITISGEVCQGKSTLASVISIYLTGLGYNVNVLPTDDKKPKNVGEYILDLADNTNVVIEEITTIREPIVTKL